MTSVNDYRRAKLTPLARARRLGSIGQSSRTLGRAERPPQVDGGWVDDVGVADDVDESRVGKQLRQVLDACVEFGVKKLFWPSTIAVFGPTTPRKNTPQWTVMEPNTIYGISKLAGERWCDYYFQKRNLDVRSVRYPGLISYKTPGGGGTTDYAIDIYFEAKKNKHFTCFLSETTRLPMMYMPDAIRGTIELMEAPAEQVKVRSSYNISAIDFTPREQTASIKKFIPEFKIDYAPDFRQKIAESWPESIDDSVAKNDWGWKPEFDLDAMTKDMLRNISAGTAQ
jgi:nucleoside-diphosphate-sugar epimerase